MMNNLPKIKKVSKIFYWLFTLLLIIVPLFYVAFWLLINQFSESLITVGTETTPMLTAKIETTPILKAALSSQLRLIGFVISSVPMLILMYVLFNLRKLFSFYVAGNIFSFTHTSLFKKIAKGLVWLVITSIIHSSALSILFSLSNPLGQRELTIGVEVSDLFVLIIAGVIFVIAWVMDEGRMIAEEQQFTV